MQEECRRIENFGSILGGKFACRTVPTMGCLHVALRRDQAILLLIGPCFLRKHRRFRIRPKSASRPWKNLKMFSSAENQQISRAYVAHSLHRIERFAGMVLMLQQHGVNARRVEGRCSAAEWTNDRSKGRLLDATNDPHLRVF